MTLRTVSLFLVLAASLAAAALPAQAARRVGPVVRAPHGLFQAAGTYHGDLVHCALVAPTQAAALKQQAYVEFQARGLPMESFSRDYEIGFGVSIIHFRTMTDRARAGYCQQVERRARRLPAP